MSKKRSEFELELVETNENIDTELLAKFESEIWEKICDGEWEIWSERWKVRDKNREVVRERNGVRKIEKIYGKW